MNVIVTFAKMLNKKTKVLYFDLQLWCRLGAQQMFPQKSAWKKKKRNSEYGCGLAGCAPRHRSIFTALVASEASPRLTSSRALRHVRRAAKLLRSSRARQSFSSGLPGSDPARAAVEGA